MKLVILVAIATALITPSVHAVPWPVIDPSRAKTKPSPPKEENAPNQPSLSPSHDYRDKYLELQEAFDEKLARLLKDLQLAYRPGTPDGWAVNAWEPYFKPTDDVPARLYNQFNADFLSHSEGRAWLKQRAAMKKQLAQTAPTRIAALRQHLQKMASISPIPPEMNQAHELLKSYVHTMNTALNDLQSLNSEPNWKPQITKFTPKRNHDLEVSTAISEVILKIEGRCPALSKNSTSTIKSPLLATANMILCYLASARVKSRLNVLVAHMRGNLTESN